MLDTITILRFILNSKDILTSRNLQGKFAYDKFLSGDEKWRKWFQILSFQIVHFLRVIAINKYFRANNFFRLDLRSFSKFFQGVRRKKKSIFRF